MAGWIQLTAIGNCGRDVDFKYTQSGVPVASWSVAVTRKFGSGDNRTEKTVWLKCTAWRQTAELANTLIKKGQQLFVVGTVDVSAYTDKNGNPAASLEMTVENFQLLGGRGDAGSGEPQTHGSAAGDDEERDLIPF